MKPKILIPAICIAINIATAYADLPGIGTGGGSDTGDSEQLTCFDPKGRLCDVWKQCGGFADVVVKPNSPYRTAYPDCECAATSWTVACRAGMYGLTTNLDYNPNKTDNNCLKEGSKQQCNLCPADGTYPGTSNPGANELIMSCYIPANTEISDDTGTYIYTEDCHYPIRQPIN